MENDAKRATHLGGGNPNILWIETAGKKSTTFVCGAYFPDNRKTKEADEVARQLLDDADQIPKEHHIIILTDSNFDPFQNKGSNRAAIRRLMSHPRLELVKRPNNQCYTRPEKKTHIDNIFVSSEVVPLITSQLQYIQIPKHARNDSDHVMIAISTKANERRPKPRQHPRGLRYDTQSLLEGRGDAYAGVLHELSTTWLDMMNPTRKELLDRKTPITPKMMDTIFDSTKFLIYSASYQTLHTKRVYSRKTGKGFMHTTTLNNMTISEKWAAVKRRLDKRVNDNTPYEEVLQELVQQGSRKKASEMRSTNKWVKRQIHKLDSLEPALLDEHEFQIQTQKAVVVLTLLIRKLRNFVAAGTDNISALQIKTAPKAFIQVLAFFAVWAAETCVFPSSLRVSRAKYIPKKDNKSFRHLSLESLLTKLLEQYIAHPIFPI